MNAKLFVYPNYRGCPREQEFGRGVLRNGTVDENEDMQERELAGLPAYVTMEEKGRVWFYVFICDPEDPVPFYRGPYTANSEDIISHPFGETT